MDFINREAECSSSDSSDNYSSNDEDNDLIGFITDDNDQEDSIDFYRDENTFENQVRPIEDCDDPQPYLYSGDLMDADIHLFSDDKFRAEEFKKSLLCSPAKMQEEPNLFFSAVVFGIYYLNAKWNATDLLAAINSIEPDKFSKLRKIKQDIMLDYTIFGYLDKCLLLNDVLARYFGCFLRFYEKRNKYRYQLRKKLKSKNEIHSEISSCVQQKFNGYDFLIEELRNYEKKNLVPHDIVYEPPKNTETPIYCFFATKIYMVYATFYSLGDKIVKSHTIQQCPYCEKFFRKTKDALSKHIKCCAGQSGYTYEFDNSIVNYQENFNKIGDLPFAIYYDFETTTGSGIFHDAKMYIVSYCIVVGFHPDLKIPHMVIYRSFD